LALGCPRRWLFCANVPRYTVRMNVLAIESSTQRLSVALRSSAGGAERENTLEAEGGANASAVVIELINSLMLSVSISSRAIDLISFGSGPGAFTGLRTACAVAQGMAFARDTPVVGISGLLCMAEAARVAAGASEVVAVLDARMGEVYWAAYEWRDAEWREVAAPQASAPQAVTVPPHFAPDWVAVGAAWGQFADSLPEPHELFDAAPHARDMLGLAEHAAARGEAVAAELASPLYVRNKVADTTAEREAVKLAKQAATTPFSEAK
jgi:tRNA threonylcarbamoyladenosine biosynthesis protein TsaB